MNYKVLYRKYRPSNFDDVVGQKNTVELLKDSIINDKVSHAYLFSGPRGTGKTSCAKIYAKAVNCLNNKNGNPCGECENCKNFLQSSDVYEIDAASNNGVDQIRELIDNIKLTPINSRYKVYIIDEVHMLSTSAFNALLLTLEEPPSHVIFILATTNVESVPITILSRCQRMDFKKIANKDMENCLEKIKNIENIDIDNDAIKEIVEYSDGGLRDALSILDQVSKCNFHISKEYILDSLGLISNKKIEELINSIEQNNVNYIEDFINICKNSNVDYKTVVKKLINSLKNRAIDIKKDNNFSRISYEKYKICCVELAESLYKCNVNIDSFSLMELILVSLVENDNPTVFQQNFIESETGNSTVFQQENKIVLKTEEKTEIIPEIDEKSNNNLTNVRINNCFVNANKDYLNDLRKLWNNFIENIREKNIKGLILDTQVVLASDSYAVIKTDLDSQSLKINQQLFKIEKKFAKFSNKNYKFVSISEKNWNEEMNKYINNKKNGKEYHLIEECDNINYDADGVFVNVEVEVQ